MFKITRKTDINENVFLIEIEAPSVAQDSRPGHHVEVQADPGGDQVLLPVSGYDRARGTVTVVHEAFDPPGLRLRTLTEGDAIHAVRGPLGAPCNIEAVGKAVFAAEDLGIASLYCRAKKHKDKGAYVICVLGYASSGDVYWEDEFSAISDELYVCTRDGSYGVSGRITDVVRGVCETHKNVDLLITIGQLDSMKKVTKAAADYNIKAVVSFDAVRQPAGRASVFDVSGVPQETFAFVRAPEVNAIEIDFDKLLARQRAILKETEKTPQPPQP